MAKKKSTTILRWTARIWAIASIGLLGAFLIGEGPPPLSIQVVLFPFGVMFGLLLAWRFERFGGLVTIVSVLLFYALEYFSRGRFPGGFAFLLFSAPGVIFVYCGFLGETA